jgi:CRP/FNR family cyclic AMP-dependent transcriptional regulator
MTQIDKTEALREAALCDELDDEERAVLAACMGLESYGDGETIATHGEDRRTLFVLASGRIDVVRPKNVDEETLHEMKVGECAGTRTFVDGQPRQANLRAHGGAEVLTLEVDAFEKLLDSHPHVVYKVMRAIFRITHSNLMRMNTETDQLQNYFLRTGHRH